MKIPIAFFLLSAYLSLYGEGQNLAYLPKPSCPFNRSAQDAEAQSLIAGIRQAMEELREKCPGAAAQIDTTKAALENLDQITGLKSQVNPNLGGRTFFAIEPNCGNYQSVLVHEKEMTERLNQRQLDLPPSSEYGQCRASKNPARCFNDVLAEKLLRAEANCRSAEIESKRLDQVEGIKEAVIQSRVLLTSLGEKNCGGVRNWREVQRAGLHTVLRVAHAAASLEPTVAAASVGMALGADVLSAGIEALFGPGQVEQMKRDEAFVNESFPKIACLYTEIQDRLISCETPRPVLKGPQATLAERSLFEIGKQANEDLAKARKLAAQNPAALDDSREGNLLDSLVAKLKMAIHNPTNLEGPLITLQSYLGQVSSDLASLESKLEPEAKRLLGPSFRRGTVLIGKEIQGLLQLVENFHQNPQEEFEPLVQFLEGRQGKDKQPVSIDIMEAISRHSRLFSPEESGLRALARFAAVESALAAVPPQIDYAAPKLSEALTRLKVSFQNKAWDRLEDVSAKWKDNAAAASKGSALAKGGDREDFFDQYIAPVFLYCARLSGLFLFGGGAKSKQDTLWTLADEASYRKFNNLCQPFYCADQSLLTPPPAGSVDDLKESQCRAKEDWESKLYKARQMFTEGTGTQVCGQLSPVESPGLMRRWRKKLPSWRNH